MKSKIIFAWKISDAASIVGQMLMHFIMEYFNVDACKICSPRSR